VRRLDAEALDWGKGDGLLPAVVQVAGDGAVLMVGYMSRESLDRTLHDGLVTFHSRSRNTLWRKGETSGNVLELVDIAPDCDGDTLLVRARPAGPTCHLGTRTCFDGEGPTAMPGFLGRLEGVIDQRLGERPEGSYVTRLVGGGRRRVAQKVGEEGVEFALAAAAGDREAAVEEGADLLFHLMVALQEQGLSLSHVIDRLERRHKAG
jgi:phosphoribosyl-ATP pyrophosphohydrolase/phosphoribosyl-AMP cyclohydrolase